MFHKRWRNAYFPGQKLGCFRAKLGLTGASRKIILSLVLKILEREIRGKEMSKWSIPPILLKKYPLHAELANFI